jgi:hypothetical protein
MTHTRYSCPQCGAEMMPDTSAPQRPAQPDALWARAFGSDYFNALERKEQLIGLLGRWEDISYRHDMMPSFVLHQFTIAANEPGPVCLKLWCGYHEGDGSFIANVSLTDEEGGWLCDLGSALDLIALLNIDAPRAEQSPVDTLIDALLTFSQINLTPEQESCLYRQYMHKANLELVRGYILATYHFDDKSALEATQITPITAFDTKGSISLVLAREDYTAEAEEGDSLITEAGPDGQTAEVVRVVDDKVISVWANS